MGSTNRDNILASSDRMAQRGDVMRCVHRLITHTVHQPPYQLMTSILCYLLHYSGSDYTPWYKCVSYFFTYPAIPPHTPLLYKIHDPVCEWGWIIGDGLKACTIAKLTNMTKNSLNSRLSQTLLSFCLVFNLLVVYQPKRSLYKMLCLSSLPAIDKLKATPNKVIIYV